MSKHGERAHSKFSASGAERWFNCSGSVALSEGLPDKETEWSREGTQAHELLEDILLDRLDKDRPSTALVLKAPHDMRIHVTNAAQFILGLYRKNPINEIFIETRTYLDWIHPEMFGTTDVTIADHFGTLNVMDFKYGAGHAVSPKENLQMIFYGLGVAHQFHWNFRNVRLWIIQPRIRGYDGPIFWDVPMFELRSYEDKFRAAVERVENNPNEYTEGQWCHWCKAKKICPMKTEKKLEKGRALFAPLKGKDGNKATETNEKENESERSEIFGKSEAEWRKKSKAYRRY